MNKWPDPNLLSTRATAVPPTRATASAAHVARALLIISMLSIVLMSIGAFVVSYHFLYVQTYRHLHTLVELTANESVPALQFRDTQMSMEILHSIPAAEDISFAEIRDASDVVLAKYQAPPNGFLMHFASWLEVGAASQNVMVDGKQIGRVVLAGGNGPLVRGLAGLVAWGIVGLLTVSFCALLIARRYTRRITRPILEFRTFVQRLIEHRDFTQRAPASALTEIEELRSEFNLLLDEIGIRDRLLMQTNAMLQRVAYIDTLTGLPNRAMFEQSLQRIIESCAQANARACLFYLDIDAFKAVNDTFGHSAGDALLSEIGTRLRDWNPTETVAARIGGDEFVVLVAPLLESREVLAISNDLQASLDRPVPIGEHVLFPGISIGMAVFPDMTHNAEELIRIADQAMYDAKDHRHAQNRVTHWNKLSIHNFRRS